MKRKNKSVKQLDIYDEKWCKGYDEGFHAGYERCKKQLWDWEEKMFIALTCFAIPLVFVTTVLTVIRIVQLFL